MAGPDYPYTWLPLSPEDEATVKRHFGELGTCRNLVRSDPALIRVGSSFTNHCRRVRGIKVRPDDVWIVTHPKCGTTWTQELTWHIMTGVHLETGSTPLYERSPFFDMAMIRDLDQAAADQVFDDLEERESPRLIKTHYPFELLPPGLLDTCKVVYVCRGVKDAAVSYFHHEALMKSHDLLCDFVTYAREIYLPGLCLHGGYFEMLESGWRRRGHPNLMFYWYEDLQADQEGMIRRIAQFLGYSLTGEQVKRLNEHMKFKNFQKSSASNKTSPNWFEGKGQFIRKGIVGDWMNHFTPQLNKEYNTWISSSLERVGVVEESVTMTGKSVRSLFALDVQL